MVVFVVLLSRHSLSISTHVTDLSPSPSVRLCLHVCVCRSVRKMYCGKMAEWIQMSFGMMSGVSQGMSVLDGGGYRQREWGSFRVNLGCPIVTIGNVVV